MQYSHNKNQGSSRAGMVGPSNLSHFEARRLALLIPTLKKHWMWAFPREGMWAWVRLISLQEGNSQRRTQLRAVIFQPSQQLGKVKLQYGSGNLGN